MSENHKVLAVIPARSGSKGIPKKNVRTLYGKPLIQYMIEAANNAKMVDKVIVSTESAEIGKIAEECGAEVPFLRPPELAIDEVQITAPVKHAMEFYDTNNIHFEMVLSLQATSPLTISSDIDSCINKMIETGCDSVVSMKVLEEVHPWRIYDMKGDLVVPFNEYTNEDFPQRQDRPPAYKFSGAIYLRKRHLLENWNDVDFALGEDVRGILIPSDRAVDINGPIDMIVAESLVKMRTKQ